MRVNLMTNLVEPVQLFTGGQFTVSPDAIKSRVERVPVFIDFDFSQIVGVATIDVDGYADVDLARGKLKRDATVESHPFNLGFRVVFQSPPRDDGVSVAIEIKPLSISLPSSEFLFTQNARSSTATDLSRRCIVVDDVMRLSVDLIREVSRGEIFVDVKVADIETRPDGTKVLSVERNTPAAEPVEAMTVSTNSDKFRNFEDAFQTPSAGAVRGCVCGRIFYNPDGGWTWEYGELERLEQRGATSLPHACGEIALDGHLFAIDCNCWHVRASRVIRWMDAHAVSVADYLSLEKKRKQAVADAAPVVE